MAGASRRTARRAGVPRALGVGSINRKNGVIGDYTGAVILAYRN